MARAIWTGVISFGLVSVPVGLYSATEAHEVSFHQFEKGSTDRIRYRPGRDRPGPLRGPLEDDESRSREGHRKGPRRGAVATQACLMSSCPDCTQLDHCHGTLIQHADGTLECTDPDCRWERGVHDLVVGCRDETMDCCAQPAPTGSSTPAAGNTC